MVGSPLQLGWTFTSDLSQSVAHCDTSNPATFMRQKPVPHVRCVHISKFSWQLEVQSWPLWTTASTCWPEKMLPRKFHLNDTGLVYHSRFSSPTGLIKSWIPSGAPQTTSPSSAFLSASLSYKFLQNSPWSSEPSMTFSTSNSKCCHNLP